MEHALAGLKFRGMYPELLYSAGLLRVLARSRQYVEALVSDGRVVPLLLRASHPSDRVALQASYAEGRRLALEALQSLVGFKLWPSRPEEPHSKAFILEDLSSLLTDEHQ